MTPMGGGGATAHQLNWGRAGAGAILEGEGGERGSSRSVAERSQGMPQRLGRRLLAVGNAVGAGVGVWECLWGRLKAGVFGGRGYPPSPPFKLFPGWGELKEFQ